MLFSQTLQQSIHLQFMESQPTLGDRSKEILARMQSCGEDERTAMEFFYSTMPASDIGDYDFSLYHEFVEFGIFLKENSLWNSLIPENIFLNYVLYYRINNEAIENCRPYFYHALLKIIKGKSQLEACKSVRLILQK